MAFVAGDLPVDENDFPNDQYGYSNGFKRPMIEAIKRAAENPTALLAIKAQLDKALEVIAVCPGTLNGSLNSAYKF